MKKVDCKSTCEKYMDECDRCIGISRCHLEKRYLYDRTIICCGIIDDHDFKYEYAKKFIDTHIFEIIEIGE